MDDQRKTGAKRTEFRWANEFAFLNKHQTLEPRSVLDTSAETTPANAGREHSASNVANLAVAPPPTRASAISTTVMTPAPRVNTASAVAVLAASEDKKEALPRPGFAASVESGTARGALRVHAKLFDRLRSNGY